MCHAHCLLYLASKCYVKVCINFTVGIFTGIHNKQLNRAFIGASASYVYCAFRMVLITVGFPVMLMQLILWMPMRLRKNMKKFRMN
jgi:hypothetical protein